MTPMRSSASGPSRTVVTAVTVVTALAVLATLTAIVSPASGRAGTVTAAERAGRTPKGADRAFLGFAIPRTKRAASGFIGSRKVGRSVIVYRTDPRRTPPVGGFLEARWTTSFRASGGAPVGRARTACAAQLLSQYGRTSTLDKLKRIQAAGVDVAVMHLLYGNAFRFNGPAQRRRTDRVPKGPTIRAFAQNLVEDFCPLSGPYTVTFVADRPSVDVGDEVTYTASVRSSMDEPMDNVRLVITRANAAPINVRTDAAGTATVTIKATRPGPTSTDLVTRKLPQVQVRYLVPRRSGASRVAIAGLEQGLAYPRTRTVAVRALPTLSLDPDRPVVLGKNFRLRFGLSSGYPGSRTAVLQVVGPVVGAHDPVDPDGRGAAGCGDGKVIRMARATVSANTTYVSAPFKLNKTGHYLWRVTVPGDTYNKTVSVCGGGFRVTS